MPRKKPKPDDDPRPRFFDTDLDRDFYAILADVRARKVAGELRLRNIHFRRYPGALWSFEVQYEKPYLGQQEIPL
jgi:hypothetical protein